jgi:predicted small metal-binding protein
LAPCGFSVKSQDEKEIIEMTMQHAQREAQFEDLGNRVKRNDKACVNRKEE